MTDDRLKVVEIGTPNLRDVPESLERLAQQIRDGEVEPVASAVVATIDADTGMLNAYGYGDVGQRPWEIGVLNLAAHKLSLECIAEGD